MPNYPGDNGDWSGFDAFYDRLIADEQAAGMADIQWDIWNEPDYKPFWDRPQAQYLEMWKRCYQRNRTAFPNAVISGPSTVSKPNSSSWWAPYLDYVKANNVAPYMRRRSLPASPYDGRPRRRPRTSPPSPSAGRRPQWPPPSWEFQGFPPQTHGPSRLEAPCPASTGCSECGCG
jgi:hypothetical protein